MKRKRVVSVLVLVGILVSMMSFAAGAAEVAQEEVLTMEDVWAEIKAAEKEDRAADFAFKTLESLKLSSVEIKVSLNFTSTTILRDVELKDVKIKEGYGSYINFYRANIGLGVYLERAEIAILNLMEVNIICGVWLRETSIRELKLRGSVLGGEINIDEESRIQLLDFYETQVGLGISVYDGALALAIHLSRQSDVTVPVSELQDFFLGVKDLELSTNQEKTPFIIEGTVVKMSASHDSDDIWYVNIYDSEEKYEIVLRFNIVKYNYLAKDLELIEPGDNLRVEIKDKVGATKEVSRVLDLKKLSEFSAKTL